MSKIVTICYADDTQLYVSFRPADETGHLDAITAIDCCIKAIRCWMHENKLLLNEEKTEFLLIGTFKAVHGLAPAYISELISVRDTGRYDFRSNDGLLLAPCRGKTLTTLGDRSKSPPLNCGTIFCALSETPNL